MSARLSIMLALVITAWSVLAALAGLVLAFWGVCVWAFQPGWAPPWQTGPAVLCLVLYVASRVAFWVLGAIPVRHR